MPDLSLSSQKFLLELARQSIARHFKDAVGEAEAKIPKDLDINRGAFVTLKKNRMLRGCVGTFDGTKPLTENVKRMAQAAAFQDPRFPSVEKNEIPDLRIEISILGPLEPVSALTDIEIGKHGVYVRLGDKSGTFLPDVAVEQKWNVVEFVTYCAREKAGLAPEECSRAEVFRYQVDKICE